MGRFRLILSLLVVGSHVGALGYAPAGGAGIMGFFTLSGFLMARTISENYAGGSGILRFYGNRVLRIAPPLVAVGVASAIFLWVRGSAGFQLVQGSDQRFMPIELPRFSDLVNWSFPGYPYYATASTDLLPQAWSLAVEAVFYLAAPFLIMLASRRVLVPAFVAITAGSMFLAQGDGSWQRSPVATLWVFNIGVLAYFLSPLDRVTERVRTWCRLAAVVPLVGVFVMGIGRTPLEQGQVFRVVPFLVAAWLILGQWSSRRSERIDQQTGNIAYGVFLGHYLSTLMMLWIAEVVYQRTGTFAVFGGPTDWTFIASIYVFALAGGAVVYLGTERPFERLRASFRSARSPRGVSLPASVPASGIET